MGDDDRWRDEQSRVTRAHTALKEAEAATQQARHEFEDALAAANDAGASYRVMEKWLPFGFHYVGRLVNAARERQEQTA